MLCEKLKELGLFSLEKRKALVVLNSSFLSVEVIKEKKTGSYRGVWCKDRSMSIS